jgi:hypothetical protein
MMRRALLALLLATAPAYADEATPAPTPPLADEATPAPAPAVPASDSVAKTALLPPLRTGLVAVTFGGSLRPTIGLSRHDTPVVRDRWAYGIAGSSIDVGVDARVGSHVSGTLYVSVGSERAPDGTLRGRVGLERAVVAYEPSRLVRLSAGKESVPLSAQSATPTVARVFPDRIALDDTFVLPADVGLQARVTTGKVSGFAGVWNGIASDVVLEPGATERGLLYSARVELTPLGAFEFDEGRRENELRIGVGAAATYRAVTAFTPTGMAGVRSRDLRAAMSLRVAWQGLFVQSEVLRRQVTDDLSMRPDVATAAYVQASWRFRTARVDIAPLGRAGLEHIRQLSSPATGSSLELGAAVFPIARRTDRLQISALYAHVLEPDLGLVDRVLLQLRLGF